MCLCTCPRLWCWSYPEPAAVDGDLAAGLLLALPPLHQVEAVVNGQRDVALADGGVDRAGQQVGLCVQGHLHPVGQDQPQRTVQADVVAVTHLLCGSSVQSERRERERERDKEREKKTEKESEVINMLNCCVSLSGFVKPTQMGLQSK